MVWVGMGWLKTSYAWITANVLQQRIRLKPKYSLRKHFIGSWDS